jgi:hypothetical protein
VTSTFTQVAHSECTLPQLCDTKLKWLTRLFGSVSTAALNITMNAMAHSALILLALKNYEGLKDLASAWLAKRVATAVDVSLHIGIAHVLEFKLMLLRFRPPLLLQML